MLGRFLLPMPLQDPPVMRPDAQCGTHIHPTHQARSLVSKLDVILALVSPLIPATLPPLTPGSIPDKLPSKFRFANCAHSYTFQAFSRFPLPLLIEGCIVVR